MGQAKSSGTMRRVFGTLFLLPMVFAVWYDQKIGGLVLICLSFVMAFEFKRMTRMPRVTGLFVACLIVSQSIPHSENDLALVLTNGAALLASALVLAHTKKVMVALFAGLLSFCLGYASLLLLQPSGHLILVALASIIAACDTAAYFVGKLVGGPKLWPQISPNKTISGGIAGLGAAMGVTLALADFFDFNDQRHALIAGGLVGILAQAGDLLESVVKRQLQVKDSGSILPGHGGMLDRFDGYILSVPAVYFYLVVT